MFFQSHLNLSQSHIRYKNCKHVIITVTLTLISFHSAVNSYTILVLYYFFETAVTVMKQVSRCDCDEAFFYDKKKKQNPV